MMRGLFRGDGEGLAAFVGDVGPVAGGDAVLGEELGAHADAVDSGGEPGFEVLFGRFYAAGNHELGPRHRGEQSLDEFRAEDVAGEYLAEVAACLLGEAYLADGAAAGGVGHEAAVADFGNLGVEQRAYYEVGAELQVEGRGSGVDDGAYAESHFRALYGGVLDQLAEDFVGEVAAVCELEGADAAVVARLEDLLGGLEVFMVEHGHHSGGSDFGQDGLFVKFSHYSCLKS